MVDPLTEPNRSARSTVSVGHFILERVPMKLPDNHIEAHDHTHHHTHTFRCTRLTLIETHRVDLHMIFQTVFKGFSLIKGNVMGSPAAGLHLNVHPICGEAVPNL